MRADLAENPPPLAATVTLLLALGVLAAAVFLIIRSWGAA